jgi:2-(1,2-epoxy-1,2-dihydrophenyl)acetyl-CoA isomerase
MMPTGESVVVEYRGAIASIRLDRADRRNALTWPMLEALLHACEEVADDSSVRVVVLTGTGLAFCAGGDIHQFLGDDTDGLTESERRQRLVRLHRISWLLHTMAKPTIAAINGPARGPGVSLALACDFRVMASTATLEMAFACVGVPGDFGGTWFATHLLGVGRAKALYLLNPTLGAEEALVWGIVTSVAAPEQFAPVVEALACKLAAGPADTFALMKANFAAALTSPLSEFLDIEAYHMVLGLSSKEFEEGAQAFLEGRPPDFTFG